MSTSVNLRARLLKYKLNIITSEGKDTAIKTHKLIKNSKYHWNVILFG